jgi:hypothetical protein
VIFSSHAKPRVTTHFHVDISYHVNLAGPTTQFGAKNDSHHYDWHDFSMGHATPLDVTHFESKSASLFSLSFNVFL